MDATALLLSRLQFAFTISFHIIFPAFSIGLAAWLTLLEALHLATGRPAYRVLFEFWLKIFEVAFGLGQRIAGLHEALGPSRWDGSCDAVLRSLIDRVTLIPENGQLAIELRGDLAAMLAFSAHKKRPAAERAGSGGAS